MRTIWKFHIIFLILTLVLYARAKDIKFEANGDETQLRWGRHIKESENKSESVKHEEQSNSSGAVTTSQLPRSASYAMDTATDVAGNHINMDQAGPTRSPNTPSQARQINFPFNGGNFPNFNYPFQEYIPIVGTQDFFSGFPAAIQPFEQIYSNFGAQQQPFWNFYNNLPSYQSFVPGGFGLQEIQQIWQPGLQQLDQFTQQNVPPAFANNFFNYLPQPGGRQSFRSNGEQLENLLDSPHANPRPDANHFIGSDDLSNANRLLQTSPVSPQLRFNAPLDGVVHIGASPQSVLYDAVNGPARFIPDFIRNQRSAQENKEKQK